MTDESERRTRLHYRPRTPAEPDTQPDAPLWRAAQAFRLVTLIYAISYQFVSVQYYTHPRLSWFFVALMAVWSGLSAVLLSHGKVPRYQIVSTDQLVVIALMSSTRLVADHDWYTNHQTLPTTLWVTNAVISAAVYGGPWLGMASGVLMATA